VDTSDGDGDGDRRGTRARGKEAREKEMLKGPFS